MFLQGACETHDTRQDAAVTSLREMRAVLPKYYQNNSWRHLVRVRGLLYWLYIAELHYACSVNGFGQSRLRDLQARQF